MAERQPPNEERLEELEDRIDKVRRQAEDEVPGMGDQGTSMWTDAEPAFHESGEHPEEDDQTIAPPG